MVSGGKSLHVRGQIFGPGFGISSCSHFAKNASNGFSQLAAVTVGSFVPGCRGDGRICRNTLSPVEFGFVCVP